MARIGWISCTKGTEREQKTPSVTPKRRGGRRAPPPQGRVLQRDGASVRLRDIGGDGKPQPVMGGFCDGRTVWSLWFDPTPLRHSALAAECGCGAGFATVVRIGAIEAFAALGVGRAASLACAVCVIGSDAPAASAAVSDVAAACPVALDFGALGLVTLGLGALGLPALTARRGACAGGVVAEEALAAAGECRRRESRALVLHGKDEHRGCAARCAPRRSLRHAARPAARTFFARSLRSRRPAVRILHPRA